MKRYICDILGYIVAFIAVVVLVGWSIHSRILTSVNPKWPTMKVITAIGFILASILCISRSFLYRAKDRPKMLTCLGAAYGSTFILMLLSYSLIVVEVMRFFQDKNINLVTTRDSEEAIPSFITIVSLAIFSLTGLCTKNSWTVAYTLLIIGGSTLIGYFFDITNLLGAYGAIFEFVPFLTAICFVLLGIALLVARNIKTHFFITECTGIV